jgi:hypothetical protein
MGTRTTLIADPSWALTSKTSIVPAWRVGVKKAIGELKVPRQPDPHEAWVLMAAST